MRCHTLYDAVTRISFAVLKGGLGPSAVSPRHMAEYQWVQTTKEISITVLRWMQFVAVELLQTFVLQSDGREERFKSFLNAGSEAAQNGSGWLVHHLGTASSWSSSVWCRR